ncbi:MAG: hypothetical protein AAB784_00715 [Patescibacteria group bacterium]
MDIKNESFGGVRTHEREERKLAPHDVRLSDNTPLYRALMKDSDPVSGVMDIADVRDAKSRLAGIIAADPERVLALQGKTIEEARDELLAIEASIDVGEEKEMAAAGGR